MRFAEIILSLLMVCLILVGGCSSSTKKEITEHGKTVTKEVSENGITLKLAVAPSEPGLSQTLRVTVEAGGDPNVTLAIDNYGRKLTDGERVFQYQVVDSSEESLNFTEEGVSKTVQHYELNFFLGGEFELPPATLHYTLSDPSGEPGDKDPEQRTLETESITVHVRVPVDKELTEEQLAEIPTLTPVELKPPWRRGGWVVFVVVALMVFIAVVLLRWRRRRSEELVVPVPAHEWAYDQITRLVADDLVAHGRWQEYFYRVSDIVRGYVERRFSLAAPDMTTEEFLEAAAKNQQIGGDSKAELDCFLRTCDLVKYARHEPTSSECDEVLWAARKLIERTRERLVGLEGERGSNQGSNQGSNPEGDGGSTEERAA